MSRINQALSRVHPARVPDASGADTLPANPWSVDERPHDAASGAASAAAEPPAPAPARPAPSILPATEAVVASPAAAPVQETAPPDVTAAVLPVARMFREKVVGGELPPPVVEEYRRLGALIHHLQLERGVRVVMVTSAVAGEGKTLTATNLALVLSASYGRHVLLVDADLRRPSLHQVFNTVSLSGLGDILSGIGDVPPLVQIAPRLTLLTAGRPNADPLGGLTSDRMRQLLEEAREAFDFVIIDTPPVGLMADANLLASMVDVALLVVRATSTPYDLVKRATDAIGRQRIAGIVLNRAVPQHGHNYQYYAGYYRDGRSTQRG